MVILTKPVKADRHFFYGFRSRPCLRFLPTRAWDPLSTLWVIGRSPLVWLVRVYVCTGHTPHTPTTWQTRAAQTFRDDVSSKMVQLNRTLTCSHLVTPTWVSSLNTFYTKQTSLWWYTVTLLQACLRRPKFTITQLCPSSTALAYSIGWSGVTPNFKDKIECTKLVCAQESITHTSWQITYSIITVSYTSSEL